MSVQLHNDPLSVLAAECEQQAELATARWVEASSLAVATTEHAIHGSAQAGAVGDSSSLEPQLGIFSVYSGAEQQLVSHHPLEMRTLSSPTASPDQAMAPDQASAPEIALAPPSMSPPKPMKTTSPTRLPGAVNGAPHHHQPESPCNKGVTTTTGMVRGRITIPPRILASQVSDHSPRIMGRGRSLISNRKQQGAQPPSLVR